MLLLTLGGVGKSLSAAALDAAFHESGRHAFAIRLETGARRDECIWDEFIDTDQFADGGIDQAFEPAWKLFEEALNENAIAILDVGANAQAAVLRHASESKLSNIVAARGIEVFACVVISRDADLIIEAAALIAEVGELMPEAKIVIILNEISGAFISDSTKEGRACRGILTPLLERHPHIKMPLAGANSIAAFAASRRSIPEILAASENQLQAWTGLSLFHALGCKAGLTTWWREITDQVEKVFACRASN